MLKEERKRHNTEITFCKNDPTLSKGVYIKTFGCQMNVYDSDRMVDLLATKGYQQVNVPDKADMIILNTCHIRERASEKLYSELGRYSKIKNERQKQGKGILIAVAGCVAQAEGQEVLRRAPFVDIVVGPQAYQNLPILVDKIMAKRKKTEKKQGVVDIEFSSEAKFKNLPTYHGSRFSAFLTIQEGCDKFCTFCVVPYTRGPEYSRTFDEIYNEAIKMVSLGVKEITLLGQNVNAFQGVYQSSSPTSKIKLAGLLTKLAAIDEIRILRYTTSHPLDMTDDLIQAHGVLEKLPPFLHLPVQSGSDKILTRMNRRHNIKDYLHIVEKLLIARPDLKLSSDFIVGFPGETDKDFEATLNLISQVGFIQAYSFKYSSRPGTPSASMEKLVSEDVKTERLSYLQEAVEQKQRKFNNECVGQTFPVLLDRLGRKPGQLAGRSPYMQAIHVDAPLSYLGKVVELEIQSALPNSLSGVIS